MKFSVAASLAALCVLACALLTQSVAASSASNSISWSYDADRSFQSPHLTNESEEPQYDEFESETEALEQSSSSTGATADTGLNFGSTGSSGGSSGGSYSSTGSNVASSTAAGGVSSTAAGAVSSTAAVVSSTAAVGVVSSTGAAGATSSTGSTVVIPAETSTGPAITDGMPETYPLIGFSLTGNPYTLGGLVTLSSDLQTAIASSLGVTRTRVVIMSLAANAANTTSVVSFTLTAAASTSETAARTAARFFLTTGNAQAFTSTLLKKIVVGSLAQVTDRAVFNKLPTVAFKLEYDLAALPGGMTIDTFKDTLRGEIAAALSLRADRLVITNVKSGSLSVEFLVTPAVDPSVDKEADTVASDFVAQVNNPNSAFRSNSAGLGSKAIENSAAVEFPQAVQPVEVDGGNDDIGRLTRAEFGGVMAVSIFLFLSLIGGIVYFVYKRNGAGATAAKNADANSGFADVNRQPQMELQQTEEPIDLKVENPVYAVPDAPAGNPDETVQVVRIHSSLPSPQADGAREASTSSKRAADVERAYLYQSQQHEKQPPETDGF